MTNLRELRLKREVMELTLLHGDDSIKALSILRDKLFNEYELLMDNDRLLQAIDCKKDLNIVNEWYFNEKLHGNV